jgi:hypothetical protein
MTFRRHLSALVALAATIGLTAAAEANNALAQKGNACSATWNAGQATAKPDRNLKKPWSLTCTDGDPDCDIDGKIDGQCQVRIAACAIQPLSPCAPEQLTSFKLAAASKKFTGIGVPAITSDNCGTPGIATLKLKGKTGKAPKASKKLKAQINFKTIPTGKGKNALFVQCVSNPQCATLPCSGGGGEPSVSCDAICPNTPSIAGSPKQMCLTVPLVDPATGSNGSDLDTGYSGLSHNFPIPAAASLKYCLSNCDGVGDTTCDASGDTGGGTLNGTTFGAPLPLLSASLPVCVVNVFQPGPITGNFDLASGTGGEGGGPNPVNLFSETYLRTGVPDVCPRCTVPGVNDATAIGKSGTCSGTSSTPNAACVVDGFVKVAGVIQGDPNYTLSSSCRPSGRPVGTLNIPLRLTTAAAESLPGPNPCAAPPVGQSIPDACGGGSSCNATCTDCLPTSLPGQCIDPKGGIAQVCCSADARKSCFPTRSGGTIQRQGSPGTKSALFASTFCIASTNSGSIDGVAGLPGPGALLLPANITVLNHVP